MTSRTPVLLLLGALGLAACTADAAPKQDAGEDGGTSNAGDPDFYAPKSIVQVLAQERDVRWVSLDGAPANLTRFAMGEAGSADVIVLTDEDDEVGAALSIEGGLSELTRVEGDRLLRSMFKFIEEDDGSFRIAASKHSNYALDADGSAVVLRDYRSAARDTSSAGYLTFEVTRDDDKAVLAAIGRRALDAASGAFEADSGWSRKELTLGPDGLALTVGSGTALTLYAPPFDLDLPSDFNPDAVSRVTNAEFLPESDGMNPLDSLTKDILPAYEAQLGAPGLDDSTAAAAVAMLAQIATDLAAEGAAMRYPAEFYLALREGLLSRVLVSSDNFDGTLGQLTCPYVYFTNATDEDGAHHPFMIVASYNVTDTLALLWDTPRPPGDGLTMQYESQRVTRNYTVKGFLYKVPIRNYGQVESLTENLLNASLASDVGVSDFDIFNYASVGHSGFAVDGVLIYPSYNNTLEFSQSIGELSTRGMHSGRGLGAHYHADATIGSVDGLNVYNLDDYEGHAHPPIISMGFDGVAGYGAYLAGDTDSDGASVALDEYGGHTHAGYGYHYHSEVNPGVTKNGAHYDLKLLPPRGAWAGRINDIPEFWNDREPGIAGSRNAYLGVH